MILDSSAIVCIVEEEQGHGDLLTAIVTAPEIAAGTPTLSETSIVLVSRHGAAGQAALHRFLDLNSVAPIPFGADHWAIAAEAFIRFGKGRHPARLNYGDCMTYATARLAGDQLLCIGDDFAQTDLALALV